MSISVVRGKDNIGLDTTLRFAWNAVARWWAKLVNELKLFQITFGDHLAADTIIPKSAKYQ